MKKRVMVTGSSGYIGSVMCKLLKENGYDVMGVDNQYSYSKYVDLFLLQDIKDRSVARSAVEYGVGSVFHFAASADVGLSVARPALFYHNNVGATTEMMDNLVQLGWQGKMIFSSTAAVYASPPPDESIGETHPKGSPNPYGNSKHMCEQALWEISRTHSIPTTMFRYFNVAGAWEDVGDHMDAGHIIPRMCHAVKSNTLFQLYGNQKNTRDGSCVRDYVSVRDICRAHLHVTELDRQPQGVFNLGTERGTSNLEMLKAFNLFTGKNLSHIAVGSRPGDPDYLVANPKLFMDSTGFVYKHSSLEEMISSSWDYFNRNWR